MRRVPYGRTALNEELRDQKLKLEHEVGERTRELVELSTHLQNVSEREKASLARELHDELGGLLVGARMDISWAEQHLTKDDADLKLRLNRVQQNLAAGVDLKRRIIEELRPTLLDNVGLFAALRWQMKETCGGAGLQCIESYPDEEPRFKSEASIVYGAPPLLAQKALQQGPLRDGRRRGAPDLPQQALRDAVEGLRVLAPVDEGALGGRPQRHGAHLA